MQINITKEKIGFSANVENTGIFTQADTFEELILNLNEAISLEKEKVSFDNFILKI